VRGYLFRSNEIVEKFSSLNRGKVKWVVIAVIWVEIGGSAGFLQSFFVLLFQFLDFVFESLHVLIIFTFERCVFFDGISSGFSRLLSMATMVGRSE